MRRRPRRLSSRLAPCPAGRAAHGERLEGGGDAGRRAPAAPARHGKAEESSESREEEQVSSVPAPREGLARGRLKEDTELPCGSHVVSLPSPEQRGAARLCPWWPVAIIAAQCPEELCARLCLPHDRGGRQRSAAPLPLGLNAPLVAAFSGCRISRPLCNYRLVFQAHDSLLGFISGQDFSLRQHGNLWAEQANSSLAPWVNALDRRLEKGMACATGWSGGDGQDSDDWFSRGRRSERAAGRPKLNLTKQALPWSDQYKGRANLHVFEDWCGGAVRHLRKNLHFPLFPHARTTVKKLAVAPKWKNYGLRIFGYIHPFKDGDFQFSVASDDNSEFWLSSDESPSNSRLAAFVGKLGTEWTAPGEFTKFRSQVSKPLHLMSSRRYYFELLHKQDDRGSDHVEVGWRVFLPSLKFEVIDSSYISLYTDESSLKMNHVEHIPQSLASHSGSHLWEAQRDEHGADMLKTDPRDTFFLTPAIEASRVQNVLVPCAYSPTYVVKDFPIARYQGLQFVYLSFVYPNDFTRLTHMETENKCFYRESPLYLEKFGFYKYMKMDEEEEDPRQRAFLFFNADSFLDEEEEEEEEGVDSPEPTEPAAQAVAPSTPAAPQRGGKARAAQEKVYVTRLQTGKSKAPAQEPAFPSIFLYPKAPRKVHLRSRSPRRRPVPSSKVRRVPWLLSTISKEKGTAKRRSAWESLDKREEPRGQRRALPSLLLPRADGLFSREAREDATAGPGRTAATAENNSSETALLGGTRVTSFLKMSDTTASQQEGREGPGKGQEEEDEEEEVSDYSYEAAELPPSWLEDSINWQRTFSVGSVDFELLRSDWNDLRCNVSGNLQLGESEVVDVVAQYLEKLNEKNGGIYTLLRIINVEKRRDTARGNRYLLELELAERGQRTVRLSEYVYVLLHQGKQDDSAEANPEGPALAATEPQPSAWSVLYGKPILCQPLHLSWKQDVMVHFVVPVKNQARWVQQFISDMAGLYGATKDANFNVILVDFDSEDMDVEKALQEAPLPRSLYLRRTGNFELSAGLQAGVDTVEDGHSIVFLCDLHIHFPPNILDSIRKHCVEGKLAYAPIVMRLSCGSSPREPNGYWEVNGFGLFGIYKSDFDRVGGMNTEEFRDRWGGEDWELLDRVLQSGLEVERLRLRNFYHYYHSKRGMWNARSRKALKD
ncbi:PREDICTED: N-acetyl-beta-glucosaminyl-glycoprotein 4-beta-N-acetylgalactosaminyltransferase 1 [Tinamus guttatus]|uniref:N-acetyl-beta-glucosaminyl-glycoprotein 4-beta-N-acetylgalactosaminyltransferase 1 n=1 Tax=Tinamus guttatus TaxID=94827 RepID=UPI00052EF339|nr:PREDICTED: N-acetyl-beta-glucosaminyl-glycoprotein 4-beta-N-acetylgalactosaminyltransferase 1 [Tinamus guttatus]